MNALTQVRALTGFLLAVAGACLWLLPTTEFGSRESENGLEQLKTGNRKDVISEVPACAGMTF
jgi:hypothetical protein